jgi:hypothetical protein
MTNGGKKSGVASTVINWFGVLTALAMIIRMLIVLSGTTATNPLFSMVTVWSNLLLLWWGDVVKPAGAPMSVIANYALAAVFWLLVTRLVARFLR